MDTSHILHERLILQKTKQSSISHVKNLNCWGKGLSDVDILKFMPYIQILSLSVNKISSLKPFSGLLDLRELYLRKNEVRDFYELQHIQKLRNLSVLWLMDNPITHHQDYRLKVIAALPQLQKLDSDEITEEERAIARQRYPSFHDIVHSSQGYNAMYQDSNQAPDLSNPLTNQVLNQISNHGLNHESHHGSKQVSNQELNHEVYQSPNPHRFTSVQGPQYEEMAPDSPSHLYEPNEKYSSPSRTYSAADSHANNHGVNNHGVNHAYALQQNDNPPPSSHRSQWSAPNEVKLSHAQNLRENETYVYDQYEQNGEIQRLRGTVENLQLQLQIQQEKQQVAEEKQRILQQRDNGILEAALILVRNMSPSQLATLRQEIDQLSSL